jgi:hypothetical protein
MMHASKTRQCRIRLPNSSKKICKTVQDTIGEWRRCGESSAALAGKISPVTYQKLSDAHVAQKEKVSKLKKEDFDAHQQQVGQVLTVIDEASKLPPDHVPAVMASNRGTA